MEELPLPAATEPNTIDCGRHRICNGGCGRPVSVCLCDKLPSQLIPTNTQIVVLQHPHELRQKLATVPLISKCLNDCRLIVGRRLRQGSCPLLDSLYHQPRPSLNAIFLFPGTNAMPSIDINQWKSSLADSCSERHVMIVFDGTWKHAKEMMTASLPFISKFATAVHFNCDYEVSGGSIYDSDLILKKEPFRGCMSTMEAVARALGILEPDGTRIEAALIDVLKSMVHLQSCYLKSIKPRVKLLKKGLEKSTTVDIG
ncbi:tRNA-uridine aminocarboxypropyltransferase A [Silene latifolia]|uniref:tRNA-uridine aminocarboxypropyltransferase A n=1 Tax=Silene latifolia TaxID=37657 RepID=UPI003D783CE9